MIGNKFLHPFSGQIDVFPLRSSPLSPLMIFSFYSVLQPMTHLKNVHFIFASVVDITIYYNGFHGDLNETFFIGEVDEVSKQLVKVTYECINQAIASGM